MLCDSFVLSFNTGFELWKSKFEVEFLDRLQDLELQVRMVCGENIEFKKVISRLYNFATASHSEVKAQNICVAEQNRAFGGNLGSDLSLQGPEAQSNWQRAQGHQSKDGEAAEVQGNNW